jgi:hypothetical protein
MNTMDPRDRKNPDEEEGGPSLWDELTGGDDDSGSRTEKGDVEIYREEDTLPDRDRPPKSEEDE